MQALCDGGGIDEEAAAQGTADVWKELVEGDLRLWKCKQITGRDTALKYPCIFVMNK